MQLHMRLFQVDGFGDPAPHNATMRQEGKIPRQIFGQFGTVKSAPITVGLLLNANTQVFFTHLHQHDIQILRTSPKQALDCPRLGMRSAASAWPLPLPPLLIWIMVKPV